MEGVRALANGSGEIAPTLGAACGGGPDALGPGRHTDPPRTPGLLVLRAPPVRWSDHATLAGDSALLSALQTACRGDLLLLPVDEAGPSSSPAATLLRTALTRSLASLWKGGSGDEAYLREVVSGARAANRVGRRLRELGVAL